MSSSTVLKTQSFEGEIKTTQGQIRKRKFKLRTIGIERQTPQNKSLTSVGSQAVPLEQYYTAGKLIQPPYDLNDLALLVEHSNILNECLDVMSVNIGGFGYTFRPRLMSDKVKEKFELDIKNEKISLQIFWESICSDHSFIEARKRMRRDLESLGNGYFELIPTISNNQISEIKHIPGHSIRLGKMSDNAIEYDFYRVNPAKNWEIEIIKRKKRFRNFVQVDRTGQNLVWFKEWRDPRLMDKRTGEYSDGVSLANQATSLAHFKIYNGRSPYGIPRYIGRYVAILGSRRSEEINYFTMGSNMVPSCFVCVEDGELTKDSIDRLNEILETQIGEDLNYSKFVLLEAETTVDDPVPGQSGKARIRVEPMAKVQPKDQLFQAYDLNNQNKIRHAWRIPAIFVGRSDDYSRATASASRQLADEQVFAPEREPIDWFANQLIISMGARFHMFKTRTPNITDNTELIKAMGIAEKSGGMTPRRADVLLEDIFDGSVGPLPHEIDPDIPYSLQFAWAQNALKVPEGKEEMSREKSDWTDEYLNELLRE